MSEAKALVQNILGAFGRGDAAFILAHVAPACSWRASLAPELPYAGNLVGPQGAGQFLMGIAQSLDVTSFQVDKFVGEGDDVVAIGHWGGKAKATGKDFQAAFALYFRVQNNMVVEFRGHEDTAVTVAAMR